MTARILNCTPAEYHSDPCSTPSLSSSVAHALVSKSPKHAWLQHPKLGGGSNWSSKSADKGTIVHELLLGEGRGLSVILAPDYRTNAAKEARDDARSNGLTPVLEAEYLEAKSVVKELRAGLVEFGVDLSGSSEVVVAWEERTPGGLTVQARGMIDHLVINEGVIFDLKTIRSAHPKTCSKHLAEYGYAVQWAAYTSAVGKLRPDLVGRTDFVFLFAEIEPPFCITPVRLSAMARQLGQSQWDRAVETWARCLLTNKWPGYVDRIIDIDPPAWAMADELGSAA